MTAVDAYMRECVALEVRASFRGEDVAAILTRIGAERPPDDDLRRHVETRRRDGINR